MLPAFFTRLLGKFLLWLVPGFLLASAAGIYCVVEYNLSRDVELIIARVGNHSGRVAAALTRHEIDADKGLGADLMASLLADRAVRCAEYRIADTGPALVVIPQGLACEGDSASQKLEVPVDDLADSKLVIQLDFAEINEARRRGRDFALIALAFGLFVAMAASYIAFRQTIKLPLQRLLASISHAARTGEVTPVETHSRDELGVVINSYNALQDKLLAEAASLRGSLAHIDRLYHTTPAPMFCVDADGRLTEASHFWLTFTGYEQSEVIGSPVAAFIRASQSNADAARLIVCAASGEDQLDNEVLVRHKSGREIDALLAATARDAAAGGYLCVLTDISHLRRTERELQRVAVTDRLTGLPNRAGLADKTRVIIDALGDNDLFAILYIDLDNFKEVNDTFGHEAGDRLLIEAVRRMREACGAGPEIFRLGGDEFAIFLREAGEANRARTIAQKIIDTMALPIDVGAGVGFVAASIGLSFLPKREASWTDGLRTADLAMYQAKQEGKNRFAVYSSALGDEVGARAARALMIRQGFDSDWFSLAFQPIVRLADRRPVAAEMLLRLQSGAGPVVSTQAIIQTAEETGQMERIGDWVMADALTHGAQIAGFTDTASYLSVNLSARQLNHKLLPALRHHLANTGFPAEHLVVEITETALIGKFDEAIDILAAVRNLGVRVALDDFGTGYSSLAYFRRLPVDIIKLDRSLSSGIGTSSLSPGESRKAAALIRSVTTLASDMGISVVAEGIETEQAALELAGLGVQYGQGYLFSHPLPQRDFDEWMKAFGGEPRRTLQPQLKIA